jgi:hypothetical protein
MAKRISVMYSEVVPLKFKITRGVLNSIISNFGVVMQVSLVKAINPIVTRDTKTP